MNAVGSAEITGGIADVLRLLREKDVHLWSEGGQLRYRAPKGALTPGEIQKLRESRSAIVALLDSAADSRVNEPATIEPGGGVSVAPLTYTQLSHWNSYRPLECRSIRQVASAMRLRGPLDPSALRRCLVELVRRHGALRTRIVVRNGEPAQEIVQTGECELLVEEMIDVAYGDREAEITRRIHEFVLQPIDVREDPLFRVKLLKLASDDHVLIMATEHLISDLFSLNILWRELFAAYRQFLTGSAVSLPAVGMQFGDYAVWQRSSERAWLEKHARYWNERLISCRRLRFPEDELAWSASAPGWGTVSVRIGAELRARLLEHCRRRRTTLAMGVFAAYVGQVLRWCNAREGVFRYVSDGRNSARLENTVGYFAAALYFRVELRDQESFYDLLTQVTDEYCRAYEHADSCYFAAQSARPAVAGSPAFNWTRQSVSSLEFPRSDPSERAIRCSPVRVYPLPQADFGADKEPAFLLSDGDAEVVGDLYFPRNRFSAFMMRSFMSRFIEFLERLVADPEAPLRDIPL